MTNLRVTELDFNDIRANLKAYLQSQNEFSDYNFDGSALSVLLDVLAYNTHYTAVLAHLTANEQFIDTAVKRSSVVSLAKTLGYVPRSTTSATALVNITVRPTGMPAATLTLPTTTLFTSTINGTTYNFTVRETQTVSLARGVYEFTNVELIEGARLSMTYTVQNDSVSGPFLIPNQAVNVDTITVTVRDSANSTNVIAYTKVTSVLDAQADSKIFWIEETANETYAVIFGDNVLGAALTPGNVVNITYIAANGSAANNAKLFTLSGNIGGYTTVSVANVNSSGAYGGAEKESIDSIRFHAPRFNATRNRAVTAQDFKSLITAQYPAIKSVSVWGGEENDPPIYGKVFIALEPLNNQVITDDIKAHIADTIIKPRSVVSIQPEFVDPEFLYITLDVESKYDVTETTSSAAQIASYISNAITDYFTTNLNKLNATFHYSKLLKIIDESTNSIISSLVGINLQKRISSTQAPFQQLNFNSAIQPNTVRSSYFLTAINGSPYVVYMRDVPKTNPPQLTGTNATGTIALFARETDLILDAQYGTVDYRTGKVILDNVVITGYVGTLTDVRVRVTPQDSAKNISATVNRTTDESVAAIYPFASRNTILKLDDTAADAAAGVASGLAITALPDVENS